MDLSSGIKLGKLSHCSVCDHDLWIKPSGSGEAAPCPYCGNLVWLNTESNFKSETNRKPEVVDLEVSEPSSANRLRPGATVRIMGGTFDNFQGIIDEISEHEHCIRIMIEIFGRPTPVDFEYREIR